MFYFLREVGASYWRILWKGYVPESFQKLIYQISKFRLSLNENTYKCNHTMNNTVLVWPVNSFSIPCHTVKKCNENHYWLNFFFITFLLDRLIALLFAKSRVHFYYTRFINTSSILIFCTLSNCSPFAGAKLANFWHIFHTGDNLILILVTAVIGMLSYMHSNHEYILRK